MIERRRTRGRIIGGALAAALLILPLSLWAQQGQRGGRGFRGREMGPGMGPGMGMGLAFLRELDLTDEQRTAIRSILEETRTTGTFERLMQARETLREAIDKPEDEGTLRELAYQVGQAEADAAVEAAHIQARVQELLTAEQREELAKLKAEAKQKMEERKQRFEERRGKRGQGPGQG